MDARRCSSAVIYYLHLAAVLLIFTVTTGCSRDHGSEAVPESSPSMHTTSGDGTESSFFAPYNTPMMALEGLKPYSSIHVEVHRVDAHLPESVVARYVLISDETGAIPPTPIAYDAPIGTYRITVPQLSLNTLFYVNETEKPCCHLCDAEGQHANRFLQQDPVYLTGTRLPMGEARAYIVHDQKNWTVGELLFDLSGGAEILTIAADGYLPPTVIWTAASSAYRNDFDVIIDVDGNGKYSEADLLDAQAGTGFVVQHDNHPEKATTTAHRIEPLASDANGIRKPCFATEENLHLCMNPASRVQGLDAEARVDWVVVPYQVTWDDQDPLLPVTYVITDALQPGCTNAGLRMIWPAPLTQGFYTIVLDHDRDGVYDQGLDLLHGRRGADLPSGIEVVIAKETREWAVLIFADGDGTENPLHESRFAYLEEIRLALHEASRMHVTMFFDGAEGYVPSDAGYYSITAEEWSCVRLLGEVCCGEPHVLEEFLHWGMTRFPADHYLVAISNHGGAWFEAGKPVPLEVDPYARAIAYDEGDALNMYELEEVFRTLKTAVGHNLDIIWYQACLMGCVETAAASEPYFDFMAAHETVRLSSENPGKWARIVEFIEAGHAAIAVAKQITSAQPRATLSCAVTYDLRQLRLLHGQVKQFCTKALDWLHAMDLAMISKIEASRSLDIAGYPPLKPPLDHQRDFLDFFTHVSRSSDPVFPLEIRECADAVLSSAEGLLIARESNDPGFSGLSAWLPGNAAVLEELTEEYARISFERHSSWEEFLRALFDSVEGRGGMREVD